MAEMKTRNARMIASLDGPRVARSEEDLEAIRGAVLDYVEGLYEVDPLRIEHGVDPSLRKIGFLHSEEEGADRRTEEMSFAQLRALANRWNADGHLDAADAVKEVVVLEVLDTTASARVTAAWGVDFVHLAKIGGQWKIVNILWQSPPRLP